MREAIYEGGEMKKKGLIERLQEWAYGTIIADTGRKCWRCGRTRRLRPSFWHATFKMERHHIVRNPRLKRRECIVVLCSLCHRIQHGDRFPEDPRKPLSLEYLIDLKRQWDPDYFDLEFLQKCSLRRLSG